MGVPVHSTGNRDSLALTTGELPDRIAQLRNADIQLIEDLVRLAQHIGAIKHPENAELMAHFFAPEERVCTGVEIVAQSQVLVDGFYSAPSCFQRCRE